MLQSCEPGQNSVTPNFGSKGLLICVIPPTSDRNGNELTKHFNVAGVETENADQRNIPI